MTIISKLGPDYSLFVSTFYATKLIARTWKIHRLIEFMESLTQEKDKLVMMGTIKPSKYQALVIRDLKVDSKGKNIYKNSFDKNRDKENSQEDPLGSKKNF